MTQKEFDLAITNLEVNYCKGKAEYAEQNNLLKNELDSIEMEYHRKVKDVQQRMRNVNSNIEGLKLGYLQRKALLLKQFNTPDSEA
jgi:hypothetical protein